MKSLNFWTVFVLLMFLAPVINTAAQKAPDLTLKDIRGRTIKLSDLRGKVVLLNFWATWCVPCRTEIPDLVKKQRTYRSKGLRIVGITYPPEKKSEVRQVMRELKMNYPVVMGSRETKQVFTTSETLPLTIVIDRQGTIRAVIEGIMYEDEFEQHVVPVLGSFLWSNDAWKMRGSPSDTKQDVSYFQRLKRR